MKEVEPYELKYKVEEVLWRKYWIYKMGYYPTKIEKVVVKSTWKQKIAGKEKLNKDFKEFVNKYLNDSVFRKKLNEG